MFPGPTLLSAVSAILESALNRALALDPAGQQALMAALTGPIQFNITGPLALTYTLNRAGDRIRVGSQPADQPALEITGKPMAFATLATGDDRILATGRLEITGDTALAHQFQRALSQLDPDWEAAMARPLGDVPAHFLGQRVRGAIRWSRQAFQSLNANIEEYVHEESRSLPGRRELEATFEDIDQISLRAARLEARLNLLEDCGTTDQPESP